MTAARAWPPAATALLFAVAFYRLAFTTVDTDLWGHVLFGDNVLRTGRLPDADPYTFTAYGLPWVNHEWLAEVTFAAVWQAAGGTGLVLLKVLLGIGTVGVLFGALVAAGADPFRVGLVLYPVVLILSVGLGTVRPQMFSYFLLAALLSLMLATESGRRRVWLGIPVLTSLWANLHGGVLAGLGVLGAWAAARTVGWLAGRRRGEAPTRNSLVPLAACGLAVLAVGANPDGFRLLRFLVDTLGDTRTDNAEWAPVRLTSVEGGLAAGFIGAVVAAWAVTRRPRNPFVFVPLACSLPLPFLAIRHLPLTAIVGTMLSAAHLADLLARLGPAHPPPRPVAAGAAAVAVLLVAVGATRCETLPVAGWASFRFPDRMTDVLRRADARGNLACPFEWGEHLIWHLEPAVKVSFDGRRETVYPHDLLLKLWAFQHGGEGWDFALRHPPADLALVPQGSPTVGLLGEEGGWTRVADDGFAVLFARTDYPSLERLRATAPRPEIPADGVGSRFPDPPGRTSP